MGKNRRWTAARSNLPANIRDNRNTVVRGEVLPHRDFFIPAFFVRRHLHPDEAAKDFHTALTAYCKKRPYEPYELSKMGITILGMRALQDAFRVADVAPEPKEMLNLAKNVREHVAEVVKSKPHLLTVAMGNIAVFGNNNVLSATLQGWKGFGKHYAPKNDDGTLADKPQIVREINATVAEVVQFVSGGPNSKGDYTEVDVSVIVKQTPHFSFAKKVKGKGVTNDERATIAGEVEEFMPPELRFFDPVVHLALERQTRGGYTNNMSVADITNAGLYVRRPKFDSFVGGQELRASLTRRAA